MQSLAELNPEQQRAVEVAEGPIAIIAGPGTGKTKTLIERIHYLLTTKQIEPTRVLALTFTKKAAEEMIQRLDIAAVHISTFHGLCHELLGGDIEFISESERLALIKKLRKPTAYKGMTTRELGLLISLCKNMAIDDPAAMRFAEQYNAELHGSGLVDFDDLLIQTKERLERDPDIRKQVMQRFDYILVDEFQDTNTVQYELLQLIRGTNNICVIGDPHQSIYGFRGANGDIFSRFNYDFPTCIQIRLMVNYRSSAQVVTLSNALYDHALKHSRLESGYVRATKVLNEYSEARWIVNEIQKRLGGSDFLHAVSDDERSQHRSLSDFAILYRSRIIARQIQDLLDESGLPYQVVGDGSPYDEKDIQFLLAMLHQCAIGEPAANKHVSRAECEELFAKLDLTITPVQLAERLLAMTGRIITSNLQQFLGVLVQFSNLKDALSYVAELSEQQFYDPSAEAITLLTIHAAKGLEFQHVFLIGVEEGILPHAKADVDEEKRLFYVAATRARDTLDITYTTRRFGHQVHPSRFIEALDPQVLRREVDQSLASDQRRALKRHAKRSQASLF